MYEPQMNQYDTIYESLRKQNGLSREVACFSLHMSNQTLSDIEKGKKTPTPQTILDMSQIYSCRDLPLQYCHKECPIGERYHFSVSRKSLAEAVLMMLKEINDLTEKEVGNGLIKIVSDGQIGSDEEEKFIKLMGEIEDVVRSFLDLRSSSDYIGYQKEKAPAFAHARG